MKLTVAENERGFLFQKGTFQRMLEPGDHNYYPFLGQNAWKVGAQGMVDVKGVHMQILLRDEKFAASISTVQVPDEHIALHFVDGRLRDCLRTGEYHYWNVFEQHTFRLLDTGRPEMTEALSAGLLKAVPSALYTRVEVPEGHVGLLYYDGAFQRTLESGAHLFWNGAVKVGAALVDLRVQQLDIAGQEILTADKVTLRLNFVCSYRITDPVRLVGELKDYKTQIHVATQLALRQYVGRFRFDELLEQKEDIAAFVLQQLQAAQSNLFVEFLDAGLKDVILPGEIRDIMNTVLVAEKTAQANVIARREEVASTRSLLNTARLMDENTTLMRLKELEYLERICERVGNISVGGGDLLAQLGQLMGAGRE